MMPNLEDLEDHLSSLDLWNYMPLCVSTNGYIKLVKQRMHPKPWRWHCILFRPWPRGGCMIKLVVVFTDTVWMSTGMCPILKKMLYDQGQLVNAYLDALCITKSQFYAQIARYVLDYLKRDMLDPDGGIYSVEDADSLEKEGHSRKKEGTFYVWTSQEIEEIIGRENAEIFMKFYYVKHDGDCDLSSMSDPHGEFVGKNVLIERMELEQVSAIFKLSVQDCARIFRVWP
ncbi:hypothetical protein KP509_01G063800 [Ceratopteris richardii]|uniref:Uncharacterized protein n=1 Tax=Ceratopteris richardii TaxID=49495 RepID=A0A8T2VHM8_CERRI|nr:hypothetical protein KP509_01G063800 [Ceratopteris richardii]